MPTDPVQQAVELAQFFFDFSGAVDDFRLRNFNQLSPAQQQWLKTQAQALDTRGKQCTAAALGAILQDIQPHLPAIKLAAKAASDALKHLNEVAKGMAIVDAGLALVGSIMAGNMGSIGDDVQGLCNALAPPKKP